MKKRNISQKCRFLALQRSSGKTGDRCVVVHVCSCRSSLFSGERGVWIVGTPWLRFQLLKQGFRVPRDLCSLLSTRTLPRPHTLHIHHLHTFSKRENISPLTHLAFPPRKNVRLCPCQKLKRGEGKGGWTPHHKSLPMSKGETHSGGFYRRNYHLVKKRKRPHADISQIGFVVSAVPFPAVLKGNAVVFPPFFVVDGKPCGEPKHLFQSG